MNEQASDHTVPRASSDPAPGAPRVGSEESDDATFTTLYAELRALAGALMRRERPEHTLRPTALVHEAYLRIARQMPPDCTDEKHFVRLAARAMRQILIDHARRRGAVKRGGGWERVPLDDVPSWSAPDVDVLDLERALRALEAQDPTLAQVVELRTFGGFTMEEIAAATGVTRRTTQSRWNAAREWLSREITAPCDAADGE